MSYIKKKNYENNFKDIEIGNLYDKLPIIRNNPILSPRKIYYKKIQK